MELSAAISHCIARARARFLRQECLAALADVEHDGSGFEQHEAVFLEDRYLPEGLQCTVLRLVLISLFEQAGLIGQPGFLQCPASAQVAHLAAGKVWNPSERGDLDHLARSSIEIALGVTNTPRRYSGAR
jgi:hypothetical protein